MTIVNLGRDGPAPLDPGIVDLVVDEPTPAVRPWPEGEHTQSWKRQWLVRPSDQDQARYVDYIDDTRWFAARAGEPSGLEGPLAGLSIEYLRETHAGELVQMETWPTGEHARAYQLRRLPNGEILARGQASRREG